MEVKSNLLTLGCSWTDPNFQSQFMDIEYFPKWPDIVSNYFNLNLINLGLGGRGNSYMLNTLTDTLYEENHNISAVMILWSGQDRINVFTNTGARTWNLTSALSYQDQFELIKNSKNYKHMKRHYHNIINTQFDHSADANWEIIRTDGKYVPEEFLRTVYQAQKICDINNVPMICMCGFAPFGKHVFSKARLEAINKSEYLNLDVMIQSYSNKDMEKKWTKYLQTFLECKYYDWIEDNVNFLGFPIYPELGGWDTDTGVFKDRQLRREGKSPYRVSPDDAHPNAEGHKVIANEFIKAYKEILS